MADRRILKTGKDHSKTKGSGEVITSVCGLWGEGGKLMRTWKETAVSHIKNRTHTYYVKDSKGNRADVHVYADKHLRTDPNSKCEDNLHSLPDC